MPNKKLAVSGVFVLSLLVVSSIFAAGFVFASKYSNSNLQFAPLFEVAPVNVTVSSSGSFSCNSPSPPFDFHCYTPSNITAAYNINPLYKEGLNGAGETIVIVDSYGSPTALQDLQLFSKTFGLPVPNSTGGPTLTIVNPTGTPTFNNNMHGVQYGWAEETSLDLQWSHAIAPMANLVLIEANPAETEGVQGFPSIFAGEQYAIQHYPGSVISQSFAVTEQSFNSAAQTQVAKFDQIYEQAVTNHVTVLGSAGDSGTANVIGGQGASPVKTLPYPTVNWPSSDPLVTSAGGTWLQYGWTWNPSSPTDTSYSYTLGSRTEAVWNEPFLPAATGGGLSVLYPTPSFQSGISQSILHGARGLPDVSWNAAVDGGVLVYLGFLGSASGFYIFGGTSAASPQIAGLIALTNQLADQYREQHVGYLNPLLYKLPSSAFNDIVPQTFGLVTISNNSLYGSGVAGYSATTGWDLATGFGSPNAANFVTDLASALPSLP
ncbi:MAG: S53 family peptidase [Nitrososphaerota archaeon]|nr:S53 family peptidase [Nitrososphaerota archaeon]